MAKQFFTNESLSTLIDETKTRINSAVSNKANASDLTSHTSNKSNPHGVTLSQLGITATATELNALDGITATVTELNYVDGVTSNIQTQLNGKAASGHTHTIANITNLQTTLDGKAASSHTHKVANISDLTATATELNYMDGVTSNVQTQLDGKAASGHTHSAATTSASGLMTAAMVTKLNGIANGANAYSHPTYTARTGVPTANQTPAFGGTFTVSQPVSDGTGHITAVNSRTITIPSAVATSSANGLMGKSDKAKLDGMVLATVSEVETYLGI